MVKKKGIQSEKKKRQEDEKMMEKIMEENHESSDSESEIDQLSDLENDTSKDHKSALSKLENTDPEFFKFLKENDQELLAFSDDDDDNSNSSEDDDVKKEKYHMTPEKLEVASDDSEGSGDEEEEDPSQKITVSKINAWKKQLQDAPNVPLIRSIVSAFESAVIQASGTNVPENEAVHVRGGPAFNAIMKVCMLDLQPAIHKVMKLPWPPGQKKDFDPKKSKSWTKMKKAMKTYLSNVMQILSVVCDPSILEVILKHVHQMIPFVIAYPKITKLFIKTLIKLWCTGEETVRILAFLSIMAICRKNTDQLLDTILKQMYMAYVKNCKFTSPSTWPVINFMKRSLVEVYALDEVLSYQHAFVYIRQLAIHLRNAITLKKQDAIQSVYNWQYVHCVFLWTHLLSSLPSSDILQPLVYPLVQTIVGTIKLIPTQKYLPLRFHLVDALTKLSSETHTFIPTLPFIIEVLDLVNLNKRHTNVSFKPMDFSCVLKLSKKQMTENGFKDQAVDHIYEAMMDYLHSQSHKIGFPELVLPAIIKLKSFIKACKVANYNKQLKQLMDKTIENSNYITDQRKAFSSSISDSTAVESWECQCRENGTPLSKFYSSWRKMKNVEKAHMIAQKNQNIKKKEYADMPDLPKHKKALKKKTPGKRKAGELFSDSEDESDMDISEYLTGEDSGKNNDKKISKIDERSSKKKSKTESPTKAKASPKKKMKGEAAKAAKVSKIQRQVSDDSDLEDEIEDIVLSSSDGEE